MASSKDVVLMICLCGKRYDPAKGGGYGTCAYAMQSYKILGSTSENMKQHLLKAQVERSWYT